MKNTNHTSSETSHPKGKNKGATLRLVAWETTRNCNLSCVHCRASAEHGPFTGELDTQASFHLLDQIAEVGEPIVILTGGEPLLRPDIFDIARYGTDKGLRMVMAPNGTLITEKTTRQMADAGIQRISVSLDGATRESHDKFRGVQGAFDGALRGIRRVKDAGIEFQINTTITKTNLSEIPKIQELAIKLGAVAHHIFLLVPTGRRILRQRAKQEGKSVTFKTHGMDAVTRGCLGGTGFCFISYRGIVQPCGFLQVNCGDITKTSFAEIWNHSDVFLSLRNFDNLKGKCHGCEFRKVCGGCRARAYEATGDFLAEEPLCSYQPASTNK
ncbi:MAG: radical SAM protein [Deltaproteobacteria bacterium]|nr:radical SAM protein [Deltaproteobacteria bacterium]